jgi:hypothetical protein
VSPLSLTDLAQRYKDAQFQYQRNLELMQAAQQAVIVSTEPEVIEVEETAVITTTTDVKPTKAKKAKTKTKKKAAIK